MDDVTIHIDELVVDDADVDLDLVCGRLSDDLDQGRSSGTMSIRTSGGERLIDWR